MCPIVFSTQKPLAPTALIQINFSSLGKWGKVQFLNNFVHQLHPFFLSSHSHQQKQLGIVMINQGGSTPVKYGHRSLFWNGHNPAEAKAEMQFLAETSGIQEIQR